MKKSIITLIVSVFAFMSINAEEVVTNNESNEVQSTQLEAQPVENGHMLLYPNLYGDTNLVPSTKNMAATYDDQGYRNVQQWKNGRTLRTVGIVATGVGVASVLAGVATINDNSDNNAGKVISKIMFGPAIIGWGIAATAAGGIMWAVGNHKMKNARLSYTGNGLVYRF